MPSSETSYLEAVSGFAWLQTRTESISCITHAEHGGCGLHGKRWVIELASRGVLSPGPEGFQILTENINKIVFKNKDHVLTM